MVDVKSTPSDLPTAADTGRVKASSRSIPTTITDAGALAEEQYQAFFAAYGNPLTRQQYEMQAERFFRWAEAQELPLARIHAFDVAFYVEELRQSLHPTSVTSYRSMIGRLFGHLKDAGLIPENPFDDHVADGGVAADSTAAVEWQATVDAAEAALIADSLHQAGVPLSGTPVNKQLCEKVIALGKARGITPDYEAVDAALAALFESQGFSRPHLDARDTLPAADHAISDGQ